MSHKHSALPESHDTEDAWHHHTADEHPQDAHGENVNVPQLLLYGTACFAIVVVSVVATAIYYYSYTHSIKIARSENFDLEPGAKVKIQDEFNAHKSKAEAETLKGLRGEAGALEKTANHYAKKKGN